MSLLAARSSSALTSRKPVRGLFALLGAALLLGAPSAARAASITGTVIGPDGEPFRAAFVEAQNLKTKITTIVLSQKDGTYRIDHLPAGMYNVQVNKIGYRVEQNRVLDLSTQPSVTAAFALQKAAVLWSDLNIYQGILLLPNLPGKNVLFAEGNDVASRDSACAVCHSFQKKMAPYIRTETEWRSRVEFMKETMHCCTGNQKTSAQDEKDLVSYLTAVFGPKSVLPASPADDPRYQATVNPISDEALNIVYVEYELPGPDRMPWSAVPDGKGHVWLPYKSDQNKIARVNIDTGVVTEYRVPFKGVAQVHSVFPAADGGVWLAESNGPPNLGRWDPKTEVITEYPDTGGKHTVRSRPDGLVCASGRLSLFDPKTNEYTHFDNAPNAYGVVFDNDGNCWFTQYGKSGKFGRIDVKTKQAKMWMAPSQEAGRFAYLRRIQVDKNGIVWMSESEANQILRFDPKTETSREFPLPGPMATPYAMNLDKDGFIWYSSEYMDVYGRMDPTTGKTVEYPFPHAENFSREFFFDDQGRNWYATPSNNKVGYFYLAPRR
jgi:streptogramin lyase